jgi:hypothetical protein
MSTPVTTPAAESVTRPTTEPTTRPTRERRLARLFGLEGDKWMRHANPWSVWTRFAFLPMLAVAIWSREWIGWWCLVPVAAALVFVMVNPLLFAEPRSTRNWASQGVLGERIYADRNTVEIPPQFRRTRVPMVTYGLQLPGLACLAYGLAVADPVAVVAGLLIVQGSKAWFIDRMVLLFEHMKGTDPEYASWDYSRR